MSPKAESLDHLLASSVTLGLLCVGHRPEAMALVAGVITSAATIIWLSGALWEERLMGFPTTFCPSSQCSRAPLARSSTGAAVERDALDSAAIA